MFSIVYIDKHNQESGSYQIVDQCQIGRAKTCDICLLSLSNNISLVHAVIKKQGDSFTITPFGLVEINGVATQEPSLLNDNDLFSIANKKFRFVIGSYDPLAPSYSKHTLASAKKLKRPSSPRLTPSKRNCSPRPTPSKRARTSPIAPHSTPLKPSETPKKLAPELFDTLLPVDSPIKRGDKTLLHGRKSILREPVQMEQCEEPNEVHGMLPGDLLREKFLQEQEESSMQEFESKLKSYSPRPRSSELFSSQIQVEESFRRKSVGDISRNRQSFSSEIVSRVVDDAIQTAVGTIFNDDVIQSLERAAQSAEFIESILEPCGVLNDSNNVQVQAELNFDTQIASNSQDEIESTGIAPNGQDEIESSGKIHVQESLAAQNVEKEYIQSTEITEPISTSRRQTRSSLTSVKLIPVSQPANLILPGSAIFDTPRRRVSVRIEKREIESNKRADVSVESSNVIIDNINEYKSQEAIKPESNRKTRSSMSLENQIPATHLILPDSAIFDTPRRVSVRIEKRVSISHTPVANPFITVEPENAVFKEMEGDSNIVEAKESPVVEIENEIVDLNIVEAQDPPVVEIENDIVDLNIVEAQESPAVEIENEIVTSNIVEAKDSPVVEIENEINASNIVEALDSPVENVDDIVTHNIVEAQYSSLVEIETRVVDNEATSNNIFQEHESREIDSFLDNVYASNINETHNAEIENDIVDKNNVVKDVDMEIVEAVIPNSTVEALEPSAVVSTMENPIIKIRGRKSTRKNVEPVTEISHGIMEAVVTHNEPIVEEFLIVHDVIGQTLVSEDANVHVSIKETQEEASIVSAIEHPNHNEAPLNVEFITQADIDDAVIEKSVPECVVEETEQTVIPVILESSNVINVDIDLALAPAAEQNSALEILELKKTRGRSSRKNQNETIVSIEPSLSKRGRRKNVENVDVAPVVDVIAPVETVQSKRGRKQAETIPIEPVQPKRGRKQAETIPIEPAVEEIASVEAVSELVKIVQPKRGRGRKQAESIPVFVEEIVSVEAAHEQDETAQPKRGRGGRKATVKPVESTIVETALVAEVVPVESEIISVQPKRGRGRKHVQSIPVVAEVVSVEAVIEPVGTSQPKRGRSRRVETVDAIAPVDVEPVEIAVIKRGRGRKQAEESNIDVMKVVESVEATVHVKRRGRNAPVVEAAAKITEEILPVESDLKTDNLKRKPSKDHEVKPKKGKIEKIVVGKENEVKVGRTMRTRV